MWGQASLQKLSITTEKDHHELLLQTELFPEQINMVGLSAAGLVLFKITWSSDSGVKTSSNIMTEGINAQVMLAYYQLANWPIKSVQLGLQDLQDLEFDLVRQSNQKFVWHLLSLFPIHQKHFPNE